MCRITKDSGFGYEVDLYDMSNAANKLGELEDFEEQIGCPLKVLSFISNHGFYCDYGYIPPCRIHRIDIFRKEIIYYDEDTNGFVEKLCYYKQTFWLKKDRSE